MDKIKKNACAGEADADGYDRILGKFPVPIVIAGFGPGHIYYVNEHACMLLRINKGEALSGSMRDYYVDKEFR